jgi:tetratricopeptide (TPR) repeat protein
MKAVKIIFGVLAGLFTLAHCIYLPKARRICTGLLLAFIFLVFGSDKALGNEEPNFVPDRQKVVQYMQMSPQNVCEELKQMSPTEAVEYSIVLASLHLYGSKNIKAANDYCDYGLSTAEKNSLNKAHILFLLAEISDISGDFAACFLYLDRAVLASKQENNNDLLKQSLFYLSNCAYRYGDFKRSLQACKQLLEVIKEHGEELEKARVLFDIGEVYYRIYRIPDANTAATEALEIYKKAENEKGIADCLKLLGNVFSAQGDDAKAKEKYELAAQHYANTNDWHGQANCNFNLALVHKRLKEYDKAIDMLQKASFFYTKSGSAVGTGIAQMELGNVYCLQKQYSKAESCLEQAEFLLKKGNDIFRLAQTFEYMGDLKAAQDKDEQAGEYYKRSIQNYKAIELIADENRVRSKLTKLGM